MWRFGHLNWQTKITSESVILQSTGSLSIYLSLMFLNATNFGIGEHPSNMKIANLNITKLRIGNKLDGTNQIYQI